MAQIDSDLIRFILKYEVELEELNDFYSKKRLDSKDNYDGIDHVQKILVANQLILFQILKILKKMGA